MKRHYFLIELIGLICCLGFSQSFGGVKGGTLSIKDVKPMLLERMNFLSGLEISHNKGVVQELTLKDGGKFLVLHIEVIIDWSDNPKATEHTLLRKNIKLIDEGNKEMPVIGQYHPPMTLESITSHIHFQKKEGRKYYMWLVFPVGNDKSAWTLNMGEVKHKVSVPDKVSEPVEKETAKFEIVKAVLLDEVQSGVLPRPESLFNVQIKPVWGRIMEITLKIEPKATNFYRRSFDGYYTDMPIPKFRFHSLDIGILFENGVHHRAFGCEKRSMVYYNMRTTQDFDGKWETLTKKVYFHVGDDTKSFRLTYRGKPVAEGTVSNKSSKQE